MHRRSPFLILSASVLMSAFAPCASSQEKIAANVPYRILTTPGQSHWFSYYDKLQFDPSDRYALSMQVDFNNRSPKPNDVIRLGMFDLQNGDRWIEFGTSSAWGWQQGCMLQWIPGSDRKVIYNDRRGDEIVSVIKDVFSGTTKILPRPIYTLSPDGETALSVDPVRLNQTRPGYGYAGPAHDWSQGGAPANDGIFRVDLEAGTAELIVSFAEIAAAKADETMPGRRHWFNHLLYNPDGTRFIFLHRWFKTLENRGGRYTRMFTANADGTDRHIVADHGMVSHFIWRDPRHILAFATEPESGDRYYLYTDRSEERETIGADVFSGDGHCTYSPDGHWMLTDTYPDRERMQSLMLYRPADGKFVLLGKFYLPPELTGETRVDLHARWNNAGNAICIDSGHSGSRQMVLLDLSGVLD